MARKKEIDYNPQNKNWKLLLYPDNPVHSSVISALQNQFSESSIWITHYSYEIDGHLITEGSGKPHMHFAVQLEKPVRCASFCKQIGLVDSESGLPDSRFLRPVSGRFDRWLIYLTHISEPDKEQYSVSDLHGSCILIDRYCKAALTYQTNQVDTRDAVYAVLDWIDLQEGVISARKFARWILNTPYFRVRQDRLVLSCLSEHNDLVYAAQRKEYLEQVSSSALVHQANIQKAAGGSVWEWSDDMFSEFHEIGE